MATYEILSGWQASIESLLSEGAYVWNNYLGTFLAFISLIMVFTTDYRLVRRFLGSKSGHKLRDWLRLLGYTAFRVMFTLWIYYGLGWLADGLLFLAKGLWEGAKWVFFFIAATFTRRGLVHFTTGVVALAFVVVTLIAIAEHFIPAFRRACEQRRAKSERRRSERRRRKRAAKGGTPGRGHPQLGNSEPQYIPQICEIEPDEDDPWRDPGDDGGYGFDK